MAFYRCSTGKNSGQLPKTLNLSLSYSIGISTQGSTTYPSASADYGDIIKRYKKFTVSKSGNVASFSCFGKTTPGTYDVTQDMSTGASISASPITLQTSQKNGSLSIMLMR